MKNASRRAAPLLVCLCLTAVGTAQDAPVAPPAGRGAAPVAAANYPAYVRPVSTYAPPRTPDGQPDISGLYVAIPLPRSIETPLVPIPNRQSRANSEFSYSLNERLCRFGIGTSGVSMLRGSGIAT